MTVNEIHPCKTIGVVIPVGPSNASFEIFIEEYRRSIAASSAAIETAIIFNNISLSRISQLQSLVPNNFRKKDLGSCSHGISKARNAGIRLLGDDVDYILFLDDDDLLRSDALSRLPRHLEDGLDIIVYGWSSKDKATGRKKIFDLPRTGSYPARRALSDDLVTYLTIPREMPYLGYVWGKAFSTKLIASNKLFFNEAISTNEDVLFLMQAMFSADGISYVNEVLVVYGFIDKKDADKASFAEHDIKIASGFVEVARYLRSITSSFQGLPETRMHRLLTRYVGYIFYFSLLRCLKGTNLGELRRQYRNSMALINTIDDEFCQRKYFVVPATGESLLIGWLNKLRWFRLAFGVCLVKTFLERKYDS